MKSPSTPESACYDVAVIGTGPAGSILGAILARNGAKVLLLDPGAHPRFSIDESPTALSSLLLRTVGERYGLPKVAAFASASGSNRLMGGTFGVQNHAGYLYHRVGLAQDPYEVAQADTTGPLHEGIHLYRQDSDSRLYYSAVSLGCTARDNVSVTSVEIDDSGVVLGTARGEEFRARYLVDTSGARSPLAAHLRVREEECRFAHRSRALWNHLLDMPALDPLLDRPGAHRPPAPWGTGTTWHVFDGGWMWSTPFGNHRSSHNQATSVGLVLDPGAHPVPEDLPAGEEFAKHVAQFPDLARQTSGTRSVRGWDGSQQMQHSSSRVVGNRWCLVGDAAGYVDPLFSRGLEQSLEAVDALAWRLLRALGDGDFSAERFEYLERLQQGRLDRTDALVHAAYVSFADPELWGAVFRTWALGQAYARRHVQAQLADYHLDGSDDHLMALEDRARPGLDLVGPDSYRDLLELTVARLSAVEQKSVTAASATDDLYALLADADRELVGPVPVRRGVRFSAGGRSMLRPAVAQQATAAWHRGIRSARRLADRSGSS